VGQRVNQLPDRQWPDCPITNWFFSNLMADVGSQLRTAREAKGLTLEQAYKLTRIKVIYLEALEANQLNALPGLVQARGFVRTYANFLSLDGEALASALEVDRSIAPEVVVSIMPKPISPPPSKPLTPPPDRSLPPAKAIEPPRLPKISVPASRDTSSASPGGIPTTWLIIGAIVLFVLGIVLVISALSSGGAQPLPTPEANMPNLLNAASIAAPKISAAPSDPVSITIVSGEHVWVRITLDGQTAFEGLMQPNESHIWQAKDEVIVETGNAAALTVTHNGRSDMLGQRGQIVARAFGHAGSEEVAPAASTHVTRTSLKSQSIATATLKP
jgi:cytoskeletal protein RodZ